MPAPSPQPPVWLSPLGNSALQRKMPRYKVTAFLSLQGNLIRCEGDTEPEAWRLLLAEATAPSPVWLWITRFDYP